MFIGIPDTNTPINPLVSGFDQSICGNPPCGCENLIAFGKRMAPTIYV